MSKAFTRENDDAPDHRPPRRALGLPAGKPNYLTAGGADRLREELDRLVRDRQEALDGAIGAASSPAPPAEAAARRAAQAVDERIHELSEHLELAEVVDSSTFDPERVRFGAAVTVVDEDDQETTFRIVGVPEADPRRGSISWLSPVARLLLGARVGDVVAFPSPRGPGDREIVRISYST